MIDGQPVPVHLHLDFLQRPPRRYCRIIGSKGSIEFDYITKKVTLNNCNGEIITTLFDRWQRNDMFVAETEHFIDCLKGLEKSMIPISEGRKTLEVCLAALESLKTKKVITL